MTIKYSKIFFWFHTLRYLLIWILSATGIFLLGEIMLPEWISSQISFLSLFTSILILSIFLICLDMALPEISKNQKPSKRYLVFIIHLGGILLILFSVLSALIFQVNWSVLIAILFLSGLIATGVVRISDS